MKLTSTINFTSDGELVLVMEQRQPHLAPPGEVTKQYMFRLSNSSGQDLGVLDPKLTKNYGYSMAIAHVGNALLQVFPRLKLNIRSYHAAGSVTSFKWSTADIESVIAQENITRPVFRPES